ncbi:MAG: rod shape-determining protein MreD [Alkaliphilus sp.]
MKNLIIGIIIVGNLILQSTLLHQFRLFGVAPNTALLMLITFALHYGKSRGAVIGAIMGLLQDVIFSRAIGINALIYMLAGYFVGMMSQKIIKENIITPVLLSVALTILSACVSLLFMYFLGFTTEIFLLFKEVVVIEAPYNAMLSVPIYIYLTRIIKSKRMQNEHY